MQLHSTILYCTPPDNARRCHETSGTDLLRPRPLTHRRGRAVRLRIGRRRARRQGGGTLTVLYTQDFAHLDPQRNYVMFAMDFGTRLLYRTLTTYAAKPGQAGTEVVPDMATGTGTTSDNGKTWTFHLKPGLKFEDGSPITSADVKYGVERSFAPDLPEGPGYARTMLEGGDQYNGPYKDKGGLDSIGTPDDQTIVFHLKEPSMDWPKITTLPTFAPVPKAKDAGVNYDKRPFSSGPTRWSRTTGARSCHWSGTPTGARRRTASARPTLTRSSWRRASRRPASTSA